MPPPRDPLRQGRLSRRLRGALVPFLYAYEEVGRTYVGCMQKVFGVEIDLELLEEAEAGHRASVLSRPRGTRCRCVRPRSRARTSADRTTSAA